MQQHHQLDINHSSSSSSFPLAQAQDEDGEEATDYENLARAAGGYMEEADHLLSYHSSSSAADVDEVLMPELANATALDCGNFVDYDEFNLCLNNILSEEDDDSGSGGGGLVRKAHHHHQQQQQQQQTWREAGDMLNIVQLNNDLGLSFQEFANETTADEQRSANSSSPQLA
ncbi:hypothetical protein KR032_002552 [Drosophila birchii]|nr:hypothetical protein KR032_002552 [Drosophila birchii]